MRCHCCDTDVPERYGAFRPMEPEGQMFLCNECIEEEEELAAKHDYPEYYEDR